MGVALCCLCDSLFEGSAEELNGNIMVAFLGKPISGNPMVAVDADPTLSIPPDGDRIKVFPMLRSFR